MYIVSAFIMCWSPFFIFDLLDVYGYIPKSRWKVKLLQIHFENICYFLVLFIQKLNNIDSPRFNFV